MASKAIRRIARFDTRLTFSPGFYFAVQSGGNFEIDYTVMDPDDKVLLEGSNERQGDYIFTANKVSRHQTSSTRDASGIKTRAD